MILGTTFTSSGLADWLHAATIAPVGDSRSSVCGIRSLPVPRATKSGSPGSRSARRSGPANTPKTVFTPRTNPTRVGASTALGQPAHTSERRTQRCDGAAMRTLSSLTQRRTSRSGRVSGSQWSRSWPNGRCWRTNYVVCDERAGDRERAAFRCSFPRGAWRGERSHEDHGGGAGAPPLGLRVGSRTLMRAIRRAELAPRETVKGSTTRE